MQKIARSISLAILTICMISPALSGGAQAAVPPETRAKTVFTIGMSQCNLGEPWRVQMNADIRAAAERHSSSSSSTRTPKTTRCGSARMWRNSSARAWT